MLEHDSAEYASTYTVAAEGQTALNTAATANALLSLLVFAKKQTTAAHSCMQLVDPGTQHEEQCEKAATLRLR